MACHSTSMILQENDFIDTFLCGVGIAMASYVELLKNNYFNNYGQTVESDDEEYIYSLLLSSMLDKIKKNREKSKTIVAVLFEPTAPDMGMKYIADGLADSSCVALFTIIKPRVLKAYLHWFYKKRDEIHFFVCEEHDFKFLVDVDIVFLPERWWPDYRPFPKNVVKVGCQHGIDMQLSTTMDDYGGAIEYDYILLGRKSVEIPDNHYINRYPNALLNKSSRRVAIIPFGSPKLDTFINAIPDNQPNKKRIIYHLSTLVFEKNREIISSILDSLVKNFKDLEVVFRCFPDDREHPFIKECVSRYQDCENFIFSVEDSYVSVYAAACCMVTTHHYQEHLFRLATGLPIIYFNHDTGDVKNISDLIFQVRKHIDKYNIPSKKDRINACVDEGVFNPGAAINYLLESIDDIKRLQVKSEWHVFELYSDENKALNEDESIELWLNEERSFDGLAVSLINSNYNNMLYRLLAAESFSRRATSMDSLRHSMLHFSEVIRNNDDASSMLKDRCISWWNKKGRILFAKLIDMLIANNQELTADERFIWLYFYKDLCDLISPINETMLKTVAPTVRCCKTHVIIPDDDLNDDVFLYGAGAVAGDFISSCRAKGKEKNFIVLDSNKQKHGMCMMGYRIYPPSLLSKAHSQSKVIICSYVFKDEIHRSIIEHYKNIKKIYYIK